MVKHSPGAGARPNLERGLMDCALAVSDRLQRPVRFRGSSARIASHGRTSPPSMRTAMMPALKHTYLPTFSRVVAIGPY